MNSYWSMIQMRTPGGRGHKSLQSPGRAIIRVAGPGDLKLDAPTGPQALALLLAATARARHCGRSGSLTLLPPGLAAPSLRAWDAQAEPGLSPDAALAARRARATGQARVSARYAIMHQDRSC